MAGLKNIFFILVVVLSTVFLTDASRATEVIKSYDSDIIVEPDGDLLVTETIAVIAEGAQIKRGIYRDFPRFNTNRRGKSIKVGFDILSIKRNGKEEPWNTVAGSSFTRIYIGDKDVFINRGLHTYEIKYRTDRQLRFFETHDELFWNVTGTEWIFAIEKASARVTLPESIEAIDTTFFTGGYGSQQKFATAEIEEPQAGRGARILFSTTQPLSPRSGLTIGVKMPVGSFDPVPAGKEWAWFWQDNKAEIVAALALIIASLYYFIRWWQIGRDPPAGIIAPRWDMPQGYSPAMANYVKQKGFGARAWKGLTSALLNLAVEGYVVLENLDDKPIISRTDKRRASNLPAGEVSLLNWLDRHARPSIKINKSSGARVKTMHSSFIKAMENEHRKGYYRHNWGSIVFGVIISVIGVIAVLATGGVGEATITLVIPIVMTGAFATILFFRLGKIFRAGSSLFKKILSAILFVVFGFFALSFGLVFIAALANQELQQALLICLLGIVMLNGLFFFLLGAPTSLGREKMDIMQGLETYLVLAEKDRMNLAGAPKMSPKHYETLLPYAVALGLEKPWSNAFQTWLLSAAAATAVAAYYGPGWYRGRFNTDNIGDTFGDMAGSIENSFTSSLPVPKSSSSGFSGGGSSGGGGGGGGGGGW